MSGLLGTHASTILDGIAYICMALTAVLWWRLYHGQKELTRLAKDENASLERLAWLLVKRLRLHGEKLPDPPWPDPGAAEGPKQ